MAAQGTGYRWGDVEVAAAAKVLVKVWGVPTLLGRVLAFDLVDKVEVEERAKADDVGVWEGCEGVGGAVVRMALSSWVPESTYACTCTYAQMHMPYAHVHVCMCMSCGEDGAELMGT